MTGITASEEDKLVKLRRRLHREPELSGQEYGTPLIIKEFLSKTGPDEVIASLGGTGLAIIYEGHEPGPCIMLRADQDALPICETNTFGHRSIHENISHKCGHDGHMTMVAGVGLKMKDNRPARGKVILLFQPAEETGQGARQVLDDPHFARLAPDMIFGLHNLPRFDSNTIYLSESTFASASCGITIRLKGQTAHAGTPHTGKSPAMAVSELISYLNYLPESYPKEISPLVTVVHVLVGEKAFGVAPGTGEVSATIRSRTTEGMEQLSEAAEKKAREIAEKYGLGIKVSFSESFPATENHKEYSDMVKKAAKRAGIKTEYLEKPFAWSEDFGHYLQDIPGAFFGLGAGKDTPDLHAENYDFPDELLSTGVNLFLSLIEEVMNSGR